MNALSFSWFDLRNFGFLNHPGLVYILYNFYLKELVLLTTYIIHYGMCRILGFNIKRGNTIFAIIDYSSDAAVIIVTSKLLETYLAVSYGNIRNRYCRYYCCNECHILQNWYNNLACKMSLSNNYNKNQMKVEVRSYWVTTSSQNNHNKLLLNFTSIPLLFNLCQNHVPTEISDKKVYSQGY